MEKIQSKDKIISIAIFPTLHSIYCINEDTDMPDFLTYKIQVVRIEEKNDNFILTHLSGSVEKIKASEYSIYYDIQRANND